MDENWESNISEADKLTLSAALKIAKDHKSKEDEELQQAIKASLQDSEPISTPTIAESSTTAQKRHREDEVLADEVDNPAKRLRQTLLRKIQQDIKRDGGIHGYGNLDVDSERDIRDIVLKPDDLNTIILDAHVDKQLRDRLAALQLHTRDSSSFQIGILSSAPAAGALLYGVSGTGKTSIVKAFAKKVRSKLLTISSSNLGTIRPGDLDNKFQRVFAFARRNYPCIIFIDDADTVFHPRSVDSHESRLKDMAQFVAEMDHLTAADYNSPIVIAATSRPFDIDEAVLRCLGYRILVDLPGPYLRSHILKFYTDDEKLAEDVNQRQLMNTTENYTGSDLRRLVYAAACASVQKGLKPGLAASSSSDSDAAWPQEEDSPRKRVLNMSNFEDAQQEVQASPRQESIRKINEFHCIYGNKVQSCAVESKEREDPKGKRPSKRYI